MDQPKKIRHDSKRRKNEGAARGTTTGSQRPLFEDDECSDIATMLLALTTATKSIRSALDVLQKGPIRADVFLQKDSVDARVQNHFYGLDNN
jgi:hypothetical protein